MSANEVKRITRELTLDERDRLRRQRATIANELPDLVQRDQMLARKPVQQAMVNVAPEVLRKQPIAQPTAITPTRNELLRARPSVPGRPLERARSQRQPGR